MEIPIEVKGIPYSLFVIFHGVWTHDNQILIIERYNERYPESAFENVEKMDHDSYQYCDCAGSEMLRSKIEKLENKLNGELYPISMGD